MEGPPPPKKVGKAVQYHCDHCGVDLTGLLRIKCAVCTDFDLCVECFSVGVEVAPHRKTHAYRVLDNMSYPLLRPDWGADEELLLLEAIEMYGLGNWEELADHVGTKSRYQCRNHYYDVYANSATCPLPDFSKAILDGDEDPDGAPPGTTFPGQSTSEKAIDDGPMTLQEAAGYLPKRAEFDTEYDNDAELLLKDMVFLDDEGEEEFELKMRVLEVYDRKIRERAFRRDFVIQRGLIDPKRERRIPREDREMVNTLRCFARLQTQDDHDEMVKSMLEECQLRRRIADLQDYRKNGITTFLEAAAFETERKRRDGKHGEIPPLTDAEIGIGSEPSAGPLSLVGLLSAELLSVAEAELCSSLGLTPGIYLRAKHALVTESVRIRMSALQAPQVVPFLDESKAKMIFAFCHKSGWLNGGV